MLYAFYMYVTRRACADVACDVFTLAELLQIDVPGIMKNISHIYSNILKPKTFFFPQAFYQVTFLESRPLPKISNQIRAKIWKSSCLMLVSDNYDSILLKDRAV